MADYKVNLPITWDRSWQASPSEVYLRCHVTADIDITINSEVTNAHCVVNNYTEKFTPGNASGNGFTNIGGISWWVPGFHRTTSMPNGNQDSFARAWEELYAASPALRERAIIAVACDDLDRTYQTRQGTQWKQMDFPLSGNVGDVQSLTIVNSFSRWHNWSFPDNNDWLAVTESDTYFSIQFAPEGDVDFPYFPFAIYKTNVWRSCNRTGGSVCRLESGAWVEKKNWLLTDDKTTSQNMLSGSWTKLPIIGEE